MEGTLKQLVHANERTWGTMGSVSRSMDRDAQAIESYERSLQHNPYSAVALAGLGGVYKARGDYRKVGYAIAFVRLAPVSMIQLLIEFAETVVKLKRVRFMG